MMRALFFLLFPLFCAGLLPAAEDVFLRESVREGIEAIYDLDYVRAQRIFDQLKKDHPESPVGYGMTAVRAWHELLFSARNLAIYRYGIPTPFDRAEPSGRASVSAQEKQFQNCNDALQQFCDKALKKNPRDPLALYFKGVSFENLATQALTLERRLFRSRNYANEAGKYHREAVEADPRLVDAYTSSAVPEYVVGSLNWLLRSTAFLVGWRADKKGAVRKLQEVSEKGIYRSTDAKVVLALLEAWKGDRQRAITLFQEVRAAHPRSFMCDISLAVGYEEAGQYSNAIRVYQDLLRDIPSKTPGVQPGEIYFRIAKNYVNLRDNTLALEHFQKALQDQGDAETMPLAYFEMARIYESRRDNDRARDCFQKAVKFGERLPLIEKEIRQARKKI